MAIPRPQVGIKLKETARHRNTMIEFDDKDLRDLQEANGFVLRNVHGRRVAIGYGFEYEDAFTFMSEYFKEYSAEDFAKQLDYADDISMFKSWFLGLKFQEDNLINWLYKAFDGIDADSLPDQYDHEKEDYLEAEDHKLDQERGK